MADRVVIIWKGERYEVTPEARDRYVKMVERGIDPITALQIATGDFVDINPPEEPTDG